MAAGSETINFLWVLFLAAVAFAFPGIVYAAVRLGRRLIAHQRRIRMIDGFWVCPKCETVNRYVRTCAHCGNMPSWKAEATSGCPVCPAPPAPAAAAAETAQEAGMIAASQTGIDSSQAACSCEQTPPEKPLVKEPSAEKPSAEEPSVEELIEQLTDRQRS